MQARGAFSAAASAVGSGQVHVGRALARWSGADAEALAGVSRRALRVTGLVLGSAFDGAPQASEVDNP